MKRRNAFLFLLLVAVLAWWGRDATRRHERQSQKWRLSETTSGSPLSQEPPIKIDREPTCCVSAQ